MDKFQVHYKENGEEQVVSTEFETEPFWPALDVLNDLANQGKTTHFEEVPRGNEQARQDTNVNKKLEDLGISDITVVKV